MSFLQEMLIYLLIPLMLCSQTCTSTNNLSAQLNDDVLGLTLLKSELNSPSSSLLSSWNVNESNSSDSSCSWKFVKCNPENGRVSELNLEDLGLSGKISSRVFQNLNHLKVLSLSHNNFTVFPELTSSIEKVNLSHNCLSGRIPSETANMSSIKFLDLSRNLLSGPIPNDLFGRFEFLTELNLAGNSLEGPIPSTLLTACSMLRSLNLSNNHFSGNLDFSSGVWLLTSLEVLDLSHNAFSGSVPPGVGALKDNLKELLMQSNEFSGPLPYDVGMCVDLKRLDLGDNFFTGMLPESLHGLNSMDYFSVTNNKLSGEFPWWIGNLSSLEYLDFSRNGFTGSLPSSVGELKSLSYLSLFGNKLSGNIPTSLASCRNLRVVLLRNNLFVGEIPKGLYDLGLEEIDFSHNQLIGSVAPGSSRLFESLRSMDLSVNKLTGHIPAEFGLFANLRYLNLSWNYLKSTIPAEPSFFQHLKELDLRSSALYGSIPCDICHSGRLGILQLDGNSLTGSIPEEIGNCSSLYLLSLSNNNLSGSIPESISNLSNLKILRLENNDLTGEIPQELGKLDNLLAVNLSYNRLVGRIPIDGVFPSLDSSALQGNLALCSPLLKGPCKMNISKPLVINPYANKNQNQVRGRGPRNASSEATRFHRHTFLSFSVIIAILLAILILFGIIVISLLNVFARKRVSFLDNTCSSSRPAGLAVGKLILFDSKYSDLGNNPESFLNKSDGIGGGIFETVYKASLCGNTVAIKKLVASDTIRCPEEFDREVRILGKAKHPNLISLLGYYWTPENQFLVMDYAQNRNLQVKLQEKMLSWATRFEIILGIAKGLAYLHHSFHPPIIHYNIKLSNIQFDENFNPKISGFGLARLSRKLDEHAMIRTRFQSAAAPELACRSIRENEKCDVYGFGMLMLEIVTGKRPVECGDDNVVILSDIVRVSLERGSILDCVDPIMIDYPENEVLPVLKLGLVCTSQVPSSRPSMAEVKQILKVIRTPFSPLNGNVLTIC